MKGAGTASRWNWKSEMQSCLEHFEIQFTVERVTPSGWVRWYPAETIETAEFAVLSRFAINLIFGQEIDLEIVN